MTSSHGLLGCFVAYLYVPALHCVTKKGLFTLLKFENVNCFCFFFFLDFYTFSTIERADFWSYLLDVFVLEVFGFAIAFLPNMQSSGRKKKFQKNKIYDDFSASKMK